MVERHDRFPGNRGAWARFDGPAGTQMLDTAISAMADFASSGETANSHGEFAAAHACARPPESLRRLQAIIDEAFGRSSETAKA